MICQTETPKIGNLEASNDGEKWIVIDTRTSQTTFEKRNMNRSYKIDYVSNEYKHYRFTFSSVNSGDMFQLSEIKLNQGSPIRTFTAYPK